MIMPDICSDRFIGTATLHVVCLLIAKLDNMPKGTLMQSVASLFTVPCTMFTGCS